MEDADALIDAAPALEGYDPETITDEIMAGFEGGMAGAGAR